MWPCTFGGPRLRAAAERRAIHWTRGFRPASSPAPAGRGAHASNLACRVRPGPVESTWKTVWNMCGGSLGRKSLSCTDMAARRVRLSTCTRQAPASGARRGWEAGAAGGSSARPRGLADRERLPAAGRGLWGGASLGADEREV